MGHLIQTLTQGLDANEWLDHWVSHNKPYDQVVFRTSQTSPTTSQIMDENRMEAGKEQVFNLFQSWAMERVGDLEDTNLDDMDEVANPLAYLMKSGRNLRDLGKALKHGGELLRKSSSWVPLPKYVLTFLNAAV